METKTTILNTINNLFVAKENKDRFFTFVEIYNEVSSLLEEKWTKDNLKEFSKSKLTEHKMGEVYKLLTLDGRFIRHDDGTWSNRKINEAF